MFIFQIKHQYSFWIIAHILFNALLPRGTDHPPFYNFLFTNLFSIKFLYFFIISSLFPYFNLFVSIFIQSYVNIKLHVSTQYIIHKACNSAGLIIHFWNFSDPIVEVNAVVRHFRDKVTSVIHQLGTRDLCQKLKHWSNCT